MASQYDDHSLARTPRVSPITWKVLQCDVCHGTDNISIVYEPGQDRNFGIMYCPDHMQLAFDSMLQHCNDAYLFPTPKCSLDTLGIIDGHLVVRRSGGRYKENNWSLGGMAFQHRTGVMAIIVSNIDQNIHKTIPLDEFLADNPTSHSHSLDEFMTELRSIRLSLYTV